MSEIDRKLFVGNLHYKTTEFNFASHFETYGEIEDIIIPKNQNGRSKGFGFITFTQSSMAKEALSASPHIIDERKVDVKLAIPKGAPKAPKSEENVPKNFQKTHKHLKKLYVYNLGSSITEWRLNNYFSKFGDVQNVYMVKNADKTPKGFGFVLFQNKESIEKVQKNRPHVIAGKEIITMRSYPDDASAENKKPTTKLFVLNAENWIEGKDIKEYFEAFGAIIAIASKANLKDNTEHIELEFEDYDVVDKILLTNNHKIKNSNLTVQKSLEKKPEEPKKENITRVETSKNKPSRSSYAPCAPPLEDLLNPGVNPSFQNYHPSLHQPVSYPSIPHAARNNTHPLSRPDTPTSSLYPNDRFARLNRIPNQSDQKKNDSVCVVS